MQDRSSIIAFSGSHGVGKTTAVFKKAHELKMKFQNKTIGICSEVSLECPYEINKETTNQSQLWMFANHLKKELTLLTQYDLIVSDRTIIDIIAYTQWAGFQELSNSMLAIARDHISVYKEIIFKPIDGNNFLFDDKHREATDQDFRTGIENVLLTLYKKIGLENKIIFEKSFGYDYVTMHNRVAGGF
ncbi:MAG: AAA family ATPase [Desulfobacterales bacterium]|nr:AAA family ATPase [Desulfobacterales bacterium]